MGAIVALLAAASSVLTCCESDTVPNVPRDVQVDLIMVPTGDVQDRCDHMGGALVVYVDRPLALAYVCHRIDK